MNLNNSILLVLLLIAVLNEQCSQIESKKIIKALLKRNSFVDPLLIDEELGLFWQQDEICVNGQNCFLKQPFSMKKINLLKFGQISLLQSIDCPCIGDYKYECGAESTFCTSSKNSCDAFLLHLKNTNNINSKKSTLNSLKNCNNSNLTIKTNLFNFKLRF